MKPLRSPLQDRQKLPRTWWAALVLLLSGLLGNSPLFPQVPPRTVESETALFRTMDENQDGVVTFEEYYRKMWSDTPGDRRFLSMAREHFDSLDQNRDGLLTLEECLAPIRNSSKGKRR